MGFGVDQGIAEVIFDGDPARNIEGMGSFAGFSPVFTDPPVNRTIFIGEEPDQPDEAITVFIDGGGVPTRGSHGINPARRPTFTVRTRAPSASDATAWAFQIYRILDAYAGTSNGVGFFTVDAASEPIPLGRDREGRGGRWVFSHTFTTITKRYDPS